VVLAHQVDAQLARMAGADPTQGRTSRRSTDRRRIFGASRSEQRPSHRHPPGLENYGIAHRLVPQGIDIAEALGFLPVHRGRKLTKDRHPNRYGLTFYPIYEELETNDWNRIKSEEQAEAIVRNVKERRTAESDRRKAGRGSWRHLQSRRRWRRREKNRMRRRRQYEREHHYARPFLNHVLGPLRHRPSHRLDDLQLNRDHIPPWLSGPKATLSGRYAPRRTLYRSARLTYPGLLGFSLARHGMLLPTGAMVAYCN
jgi:hypothetical protein